MFNNIATEVLEDKPLTASTQLEHSLLSKNKLDPTKVRSTTEWSVHNIILSTGKKHKAMFPIYLCNFSLNRYWRATDTFYKWKSKRNQFSSWYFEGSAKEKGQTWISNWKEKENCKATKKAKNTAYRLFTRIQKPVSTGTKKSIPQ